SDMGCVEPFYSLKAGIPCAAASPFELDSIADPGPVVTPLESGEAADSTAAPQPNGGIIFYLPGDWFVMEFAGGTVPADGTVWTLRQYIGAISGGRNFSGTIDYGPYTFNPSSVRTLSAVGVELAATYSVTNGASATTNRNLSQVHTVPDPY